MDMAQIQQVEIEIEVTKNKLEALSRRLDVIGSGYKGPLPRPICNCQSRGCWGCCNTEAEIQARQDIYG